MFSELIDEMRKEKKARTKKDREEQKSGAPANKRERKETKTKDGQSALDRFRRRQGANLEESDAESHEADGNEDFAGAETIGSNTSEYEKQLE